MHFIVIIITVVIAPLLHFLGCCIYNLFFHPLKSFPGPKLWAASRIPLSYWKFKGVLPYKMKELHDQYGDAVRVAPNYLDYDSSVAWEDIYGFVKENHKKNFPKNLTERASTVANQVQHIRRRKPSKISSPSITHILRQSPHILGTSYPRFINIGQWYNFATFDLIVDLAFGEPFDCVRTGETHPWIDLIFQIFEIQSLVNEAKKIPNYWDYCALFVGKFPYVNQLTREKAYRRLDTPRDVPDFMSYIIKHNDTDKGMTCEEIGENATVLIIAGSETTASLLNGLTYHLLKAPTVLQNLAIELITSFQTQEDLTLHALASSKYLNAVLEEGLRMYPPAPSTLPRIVPNGGSLVAGQYVPGGVTVGVNPISSSLSAKNFHLPYEFHPERWLSTADVEELKSAFPDMKLNDPKIFESDNKKARQPFSMGPANCIGKNLAYAEMRVLLGNVVWGFDLEGARESESWLERNRIYGLWKKPDLWVKLKRVNV
ncbi:hypothetical protein BTUL_0050g00160 [Botrytis tulipae]|uniref:Uncharacterized protein n=1 Tax=Botrytis tulipae TaxID=87230 RepID=A0A4Z1EZG4_9HELO|nr:hypothetical protein BTUL_0050g00160 [Botrytis tulipae]